MLDLSFDMDSWARGDWDEDFDWSIHEWQQAKAGDRFFLLYKNNRGSGGIIASGYLSSEPSKGNDWAQQGREVYYAKLDFEFVFHPKRTKILSIKELEIKFPQINWQGGHSGEVLDDTITDELEKMWMDHIVKHIKAFEPRAIRK